MNANHFAARLKELRDLAAPIQPQLAERAGLSKGGIADLEQARRKPAWEPSSSWRALGVEASAFEAPPSAKTGPRPRPAEEDKARRGRGEGDAEEGVSDDQESKARRTVTEREVYVGGIDSACQLPTHLVVNLPTILRRKETGQRYRRG